MIAFEGARKRYIDDAGANHVALDGLDLTVASGETLALIGPSGSGKTTALRLVNRMLELDGGAVRIDGEDVRTLDPIALRRRVGYVVQRGGLLPHLTARENVGLLGEVEGHAPDVLAARVDELLSMVRLDPGQHGKRYPAQLSGGQRQRVGVARALYLEPQLVLLDEPFGALDPITRRELQEELGALLEPATALLVTHDLREAFRMADRTALLRAGELLEVGSQAELEASPDPWVQRFLEAQRG
ncbi:MAG: ATP-binding cassette domain-containing protein [Planctomycetota bacterium]|nr:ATP-binding cassette domain-containing protein [Planctomycetota bacterium]